MQNNHECSLH